MGEEGLTGFCGRCALGTWKTFSDFLIRLADGASAVQLLSDLEKPILQQSSSMVAGQHFTGSSGKPRLTNLKQLTLDTSWYTRYRSSTHNPDLDPHFVFPQAVPDSLKGSLRPSRELTTT